MPPAQKDSPQRKQRSTLQGPFADCPSCYQPVAAPTGKGISPCIGVRVPRPVFDTLHAVAKIQGTTAAELARDAIIAVYENLLEDAALAKKLQHRQEQLGRGEEA